MLYRIEAGLFPHLDDTIGRKTAASIREALGIPVKSVRTIKVFTLEGLDAQQVNTLMAKSVLHDPVLQAVSLSPLPLPEEGTSWIIEVGYRPGVTDNEGRTARDTAALVLGIEDRSSLAVYTSIQYRLHGPLTEEQVTRIARDLLANELIQRFEIKSRAQWDAAVAAHPELPELLDGLHFHTLCEQDADALAVTLKAVEATFGDLLPKMKWVNFGGGHHVTRPGYDLATLEQCICQMQAKYGVRVYLEPGEAWALNAGYLVTTVLDTLQNGDTSLAILDTSAACHTPDVIEMPYRPPLLEAGDPGEKPCTVRLGGPTCLAGDVMGDYSFKAPLAPGQRLVFGDMAIYTTCKNNTFNGMPLPDIWLLRQDGSLARLAHIGYQDFRCRLGGRGEGTLDTTSVQI